MRRPLSPRIWPARTADAIGSLLNFSDGVNSSQSFRLQQPPRRANRALDRGVRSYVAPDVNGAVGSRDIDVRRDIAGKHDVASIDTAGTAAAEEYTVDATPFGHYQLQKLIQ